jgi:hypothetical protein
VIWKSQVRSNNIKCWCLLILIILLTKQMQRNLEMHGMMIRLLNQYHISIEETKEELKQLGAKMVKKMEGKVVMNHH